MKEFSKFLLISLQLVTILFFCVFPIFVFSGQRNTNETVNYSPNEIIVAFKSGVSDQAKIRVLLGFGKSRQFQYRPNWYLVEINNGMSVPDTIKKVKMEPEVDFAEPNRVIKAVPLNNKRFTFQEIMLTLTPVINPTLLPSVSPNPTPVPTVIPNVTPVPKPNYEPGQVLVQFKSGLTDVERKKILLEIGIAEPLFRHFSNDWLLLKITNGMSVEAAIKKLEMNKAVILAEPNYRIKFSPFE